MTVRWYTVILAEPRNYDKSLQLSRYCKTRKEAIEVKEWIDQQLAIAVKDQNHVFRMEFPVTGRQAPRSLYIRPRDYSMITVSIESDRDDPGCKTKIGFSYNDSSSVTKAIGVEVDSEETEEPEEEDE